MMFSRRSTYSERYNFVDDRTYDGRKYRMLNVVNEFTHECLAIRVSRKLKEIGVAPTFYPAVQQPSSAHNLGRDRGLNTSPAFILMKAANEFTDKTTAPNQLWQTDFTYLKVIGWGWFGSICPRCSTISRATSWPGSCVPPCRPPTYPIPCRSRCKHRV